MAHKLLVLVLVAIALPCHAAGIQGRWGLSAPIFASREDPSYSLIYAHSDRTAWAFDLSLEFRHPTNDGAGGSLLPTASVGDAFAVAGGPRLRSYRHPEADLSFYLDRFLRGAYSSRELTQPSGLSTTSKEWSVGTGIGVGCEYFIPHLHVGLAVHSDVANLRYVEDSTKSNLIGAQLATGGAVEFDYAVRPLLVVRAYF